MSKEKILKQQKGSITAFAIATVFTLIFILGGVFTASTVNRKNQLRTLLKIKEIYAKVPKLTENVQEPIDTATSYVGYYADIEGDGVVDGIIYADLAKGKTAEGNWGDSDGAYEIEAVTTGLKEYAISNKTYEGQTVAGIYKANDGFGEKQVITPVKGSSGTERFYIMALEDVDLPNKSGGDNCCFWYQKAYEKMSDYATYTSLDFGKGKENTSKMIARWKNPANYDPNYGEARKTDLWGQIESQVADGWYVPSIGEWSAFGNELRLTRSEDQEYFDVDSYGFSSHYYWSSSQSFHRGVYIAEFLQCSVWTHEILIGIGWVRLSTTF